MGGAAAGGAGRPSRLRAAIARLRSGLDRLGQRPYRLAAVCAALALMVLLPTLGDGLQVDDWWHRLYLGHEPLWEGARGPWYNLFTFFDGDARRTLALVDHGIIWWTDPAVRVSFFRPLSAALHYLDWSVLGHPWLMRLHSLLWFAGLAALVSVLYRRVLGAGFVAALASILWAIDHTHGVTAAWIANRNAIVAAVFGLASLLVHMQGRRGARASRRALASIASALLLAAGLTAGETALGMLAWIGAWALFLDEGTVRDRLRPLAPHGVVVLAWAIIYRAGGYGVRGSGLYFDPGVDPLGFVAGVLVNAPLLLASELGAPVPDTFSFAPPALRAAMVAIALVVVAIAAIALLPILARERRARFLLAGALASLLPACATMPSARLTLVPGIGLIGLIALGVEEVLSGRCSSLTPPLSVARRRIAIGFAAWAGGAHLILSPLLIQITGRQMAIVDHIIARYSSSLDGMQLTGRRLVVVNAPDAAFTSYVGMRRMFEGKPAPDFLLPLASGGHDLTLERIDDRTLEVRSDGGFYRAGTTEVLTRDPSAPMPVGTRVAGTGVDITVTHALADGRPDGARFRFASSLDDDAVFTWVRWQGPAFTRFVVPRVGERVAIPRQTVPLLP